ncbi:MAG: hypothetical protein R3C52_01370 [Hyphomonadaceae bacterium]
MNWRLLRDIDRTIVRMSIVLILLACPVLATAPASAQSGEIALSDIPGPAEIEAAFPIEGEGAARIEAAARQQAAFDHISTILYRQASKRSKPLNFRPDEQKLYTALTDDAKARIRAEMGFPKSICGPAEKDCRAFEELVTDYTVRDRKKKHALEAEIEAAFFPKREVSGVERTTGWFVIACLTGAPVLGLVVFGPFGVIYRGELNAIGSGVVYEGGGMLRMAEVRRTHLTIGGREVREFVLSPRMDDALEEAADRGGEVGLGVGRVLHLRWLLSIRSGTGTMRANLGGALLRQMFLIPFFAIVAAVLAAMLASLVLGLYLGVAVGLFFIGAGGGQILANLRAWFGA